VHEDPTSAEHVLDHLRDDARIVVPLANGEPVGLLDVVEDGAAAFRGMTVHQMHALHDRAYLSGDRREHLRHVSYFLSEVTRPHFHTGGLDLVPAHFSEVPELLAQGDGPTLVLAAASPMDDHGFFSLGTNADYTAGFVGRAPVFLEVNAAMPRSFGRNQVHVSQVAGWTEVDRPLLEVAQRDPDAVDRTIAGLVAERVHDGDTLQVGIGAIPNAILSALHGHHELGLHTELLSDGVVDLVEAGALTGTQKKVGRNKHVTTFALGTRRTHDFLDDNASVELWPVEHVNDPRTIAREEGFVSINATTEVDLLGQCASETIQGRYWSGSGGQTDFARGAMYATNGRGFVVLRSTARAGEVSRIVSRLSRGSVVTTLKNTVDHVVTEHGVAELRGRSIRERAHALVAVAAPEHRDRLRAEARELSYL
jgi:acyl-CoA hydrolase